MKNSEPRQHHIIPAFYLAGFTSSGRRHDKLYVFDYERGKRYRSTPNNVCKERDYYRVEEPGYDANAIETLMSSHEGVVAPFVQSVARNRRASNKKQVGEILAFAALLIARSRRGRIQIEGALAAGLAKRIRAGNVTPEQWEQLRESELRNGADQEDVPTYKAAVAGLQSGDWYPKAPRVLTVGLIPDAQDAVLNMLRHRNWELMITDSQVNGGFICSDSPVVWGELNETIQGLQPHLGDRNIEITFPISKDAALVSHPDASNGNCNATEEIVAHINLRTLQLSTGLVFHPHEEFLLRQFPNRAE